MNIKIKSNLIFLLTLTMVLSFSSCDTEDPFEDYFDYEYIEDIFDGQSYDVEKTQRLCKYSWYSGYYDHVGNLYEEKVFFYKDRRGKVEYYINGKPDGYLFFTWHWDNRRQTRIFIDYGDAGYSIFDDIRVSNYELSIIVDGEEVYYEALR